ncbi:hypothetical protein, partial [Pantoea septica]|uniref:hypothetical protein n=1 Tax=Pantoea septica TaxID=472695 RepID=UPI001C0F4CA6
GEEAAARLFAGEEVFSVYRLMSWKIIDGKLCVKHLNFDHDKTYDTSKLYFNAFLDENTDWYVAPPFDARKEMLARPGEWVAKFKTMSGWAFIGFDLPEMVAVYSENIGDAVDINGPAIVPAAREINEAIPLDDADLAKLAALKADEKGVEA